MKFKAKIKKYTKVWLSAFLTLAIVLQAFYGLEFNTKAESPSVISTNYTEELSFTDWGVKAEDKVYGYDIYTLTDKDRIDSLNGVLIRGKVNFNGKTENHFRIGGFQGAEHTGFTIGTQKDTGKLILWPEGIGGNGNAQVVMGTPEWSTLIYTEITLALGFTKTGDNWSVEVYVNDQLRGTYECGNATPGLYLANVGTEFENAYKEMKFSDWKYQSTRDDGQSVYLPSNVESLDGVAVTGYINFQGKEWTAVRIGGASANGGFLLCNNAGNWMIGSQWIGVNLAWTTLSNPNSICKPSGDVKVRLTFDKNDNTNDWIVTVYVEDTKVGEVPFNGVTPGLYLTIPNTVTVYHMETNKEQGLYKEMLFKDWGRHVGITTNYNMYELTDTTLLPAENSLDGVAVSGTVDFKGTTWKPIAIGGVWNVQEGGFRIANIGANINDGNEETDEEIPVRWGCDTYAIRDASRQAAPSDWIGFDTEVTKQKLTGDVTVRVTFDLDKDTSTWTINVYADGIHVGMAQYLDGYQLDNNTYQKTFGRYLAVHKQIYADVYSPKEMKFSDWGIREGKLYGFDIYSLTDKSQITTLDCVAVSGTVNYKGNYSAYFRIGGYRTDAADNRHIGVCFGMNQGEGGSSKDWGYTIWPQGVTKLPEGTPDDVIQPITMLNKTRWEQLIQQEFHLRVEFYKDIGTGNWNALVCIDDNLADGIEPKMVGNYNLGEIHPGLYMSSWVKPVGDEIPETIPEGLGGPDFYNPPTEIEVGKESLLGESFITDVDTTTDTTVISGSDTDKDYKTTTDYTGYGFDYVLDYDVDRELRILQITDTQTIDSAQSRAPGRLTQSNPNGNEESTPEKMYNKLFRYIIRTTREAKPDLILLTGDIVYGEFDDKGTSLIALINLMDSMKIPWAPVWGNHDNESEMGIDWQCQKFAESPYCIWERNLMKGGGNGNYSIGLARNGVLERAIYMMDTNGVANAKYVTYSGVKVLAGNSIYNGTEVKTAYGFTDAQRQWYEESAKKVNTTAGEKIPSFLGVHVTSEGAYEAAVAAGYHEGVTQDEIDAKLLIVNQDSQYANYTEEQKKMVATYLAKKDDVASRYVMGESKDDGVPGISPKQEGDSGFKLSTAIYEHHFQMWWYGNADFEKEIVDEMPTLGTDGVFFGHSHMNSTSILNPVTGVRWTYGLKTGSYDESPKKYGMGGTLIKLSDSSTKFTVSQISYLESEMDEVYPKFDYVLPKAEENPNYIFYDKTWKNIGYTIPSEIKDLGDTEAWTISKVTIDNEPIDTDQSKYDATTYGNVYNGLIGQYYMNYTKNYSYTNVIGGKIDTTFTQGRKLFVYMRGDANFNNSVNLGDFVHMKKGVDGNALDEVQTLCTDVDKNREVTDTDTSALAQLLFDICGEVE